MVYGNYVYTADNGVAYQVIVPTDFAAALGQTVASTQPSLDATVNPRYAWFVSASGQRRAVIIDTLANFATVIGQTVTILGVLWTCQSAVGQQIPAIFTAPNVNPAPIQGPQGPPATFQYFYTNTLINTAFPPATSTNIYTLMALPIGIYIYQAQCNIYQSSGVEDIATIECGFLSGGTTIFGSVTTDQRGTVSISSVMQNSVANSNFFVNIYPQAKTWNTYPPIGSNQNQNGGAWLLKVA